MKKVTFLLAILLVGGMMLTGCTKTGDGKGYYSFTTKEKTNTYAGDDVSGLTEALRPRLANGMYTLTKAEAKAEWNNFLKDIENVKVTINGADSYYVVQFNRKEEKDGGFVTVETIGEKSWGNVPK